MWMVDGKIHLIATIALTLSEYLRLRSFYQQKMSLGCLSYSDTTGFYRLFFVLQQHHNVTDFVAVIEVITEGTAQQSHVCSSTM